MNEDLIKKIDWAAKMINVEKGMHGYIVLESLALKCLKQGYEESFKNIFESIKDIPK